MRLDFILPKEFHIAFLNIIKKNLKIHKNLTKITKMKWVLHNKYYRSSTHWNCAGFISREASRALGVKTITVKEIPLKNLLNRH